MYYSLIDPTTKHKANFTFAHPIEDVDIVKVAEFMSERLTPEGVVKPEGVLPGWFTLEVNIPEERSIDVASVIIFLAEQQSTEERRQAILKVHELAGAITVQHQTV